MTDQMPMTAEQAVSQYTAEEAGLVVQQLTARIARLRVSHHVEIERLSTQLTSALGEVEELRSRLDKPGLNVVEDPPDDEPEETVTER